jgi:hypothetical protein
MAFPHPLKEETELQIIEAIAKIHGRYIYIPSFNDGPQRTFPEVLAVLRRAKTTKPSKALRRVVDEFRKNPQLLFLPQLVALYDDQVRPGFAVLRQTTGISSISQLFTAGRFGACA